MGSFRPVAGTRHLHRDYNFTESIVETVPKSLRLSCGSELTRQGISGNHTFNHIQGIRFWTKNYLANVEKAAEYIKSDLFRPPHGHMRFPQVFQQTGVRLEPEVRLLGCTLEEP